MREDSVEHRRAAIATLLRSMLPEPRLPPPRSREIVSPRSPALAVSTPATGARSEHPRIAVSQQLFRRSAHYLPDLDGLVAPVFGAGRRRDPRSKLVSLLGALDVDDPESSEEFLG